ncbi:hypothetical protein DAPPUDRAFT_247981 [Daphnia pulex]|uniref:Uncharacterized protein n=1 Tax=Daphnia pulex TaxID=6669 RepID=E9GTG5_DAPPU|nr:hypothetical protein DAPPUDRAFT_247981 [Daphnia pulex]|eukprot:EFX77220.1 hypothetical protein DAPPUDRAFT_247981 [Daphnia pulex]
MGKIVLGTLLAVMGTVMMSEAKWMTAATTLVTKKSGTVTDLASIYDRATKHHPAIGNNKRRHHTARLHANGWNMDSTTDQHPVNSSFLSSSTAPSSVAAEEEVDHLSQQHTSNKQETNIRPPSISQQTTNNAGRRKNLRVGNLICGLTPSLLLRKSAGTRSECKE